tara:strand:+ start:1508 stop:1738 length:231 start_codon:yes stop_codon:yes gene_type:complete
MRAIIAASILVLSGCETIRVNGVEITREDQIGWGLFLAVTGAAIYHLAEDNDDEAQTKCAQFVSVPTGKGGSICAE